MNDEIKYILNTKYISQVYYLCFSVTWRVREGELWRAGELDWARGQRLSYCHGKIFSPCHKKIFCCGHRKIFCPCYCRISYLCQRKIFYPCHRKTSCCYHRRPPCCPGRGTSGWPPRCVCSPAAAAATAGPAESPAAGPAYLHTGRFLKPPVSYDLFAGVPISSLLSMFRQLFIIVCLNGFLNVRTLVDAFNQERAQVGSFSVIAQL